MRYDTKHNITTSLFTLPIVLSLIFGIVKGIISLIILDSILLLICIDTFVLVNKNKSIISLYRAYRIKKKKLAFKKVYFFKYQSKETVAARKLVRGFLDKNDDKYNKFYIREVIGNIKGETLNIIIVTDRPGLIIGKGGRYLEQFKRYAYKNYNRNPPPYLDINIKIEESQYWPTSYENDDLMMQETNNEYDEYCNNENKQL